MMNESNSCQYMQKITIIRRFDIVGNKRVKVLPKVPFYEYAIQIIGDLLLAENK